MLAFPQSLRDDPVIRCSLEWLSRTTADVAAIACLTERPGDGHSLPSWESKRPRERRMHERDWKREE